MNFRRKDRDWNEIRHREIWNVTQNQSLLSSINILIQNLSEKEPVFGKYQYRYWKFDLKIIMLFNRSPINWNHRNTHRGLKREAWTEFEKRKVRKLSVRILVYFFFFLQNLLIFELFLTKFLSYNWGTMEKFSKDFWIWESFCEYVIFIVNRD